MIGAQWLADPPPGWRVVPLRALFERRKVLGFIDEPMVSVFRDHGVVFKDSRENLNQTAEDRSIYQLIDNGWLVVNRMKAWQGSVGVSAIRGIVSGHYICFQPSHREESRYLNHLLRSPIYATMFGALSRGVRNGQIEIDNDDLGSLGVLLPPVEEQRRIADFLDDQTTRIDRLMSGRQQQIDSVAEAVSAFAFAAVTGQARSERMSTGIPWAPDLPVGWGAPRLNQVARMGTGHTPSRSVPEYWVDCDIPWLTTTDVHKFRKDEIDTLDETEIQISELGLANSAAVLHPRGTVALSRTASAGFSIVMGRDMATSQDFATWTCGPALDNRFVLWCLRAMRRDLLGRLAMGSTHKTIYFPDLMSIRVPLPPMAEQRDAVAAITAFAADARGAKAEIARSIDLLQEFKRSLISAAVSGEFNVSAASGRGVPA